MAFTKEAHYYKNRVAVSDTPTDISIGNPSGTKFIPQVDFSKWEGEAWLRILYPKSVGTEQAVYDSVNDKITLTVGTDTFGWYLHPDESLEFEIVLGSKPPGNKNVFVFNLDFPVGLDFWYQPALTQQEINLGAIRPEKVVGSYAVYWNKKNNQYKTGKLCHIYRPQLTDALGNKSWANLAIDPIAKTLTITADQNFIRNANYPVTIDPEIGYHTIGGSSSDLTGYIVGARFSCGTAGTVNPGTLYIYTSNTGNKICGIYANGAGTWTGQNKLSTSDPVISGDSGWDSGSVSSSDLSSGTDYWLVANGGSGAGSLYYDTTTAGYEDLEYAVRAYDGTLPSTGPSTSPLSWEMSIYLEYTAGGGGTLSINVYDSLSRTEALD